MTLGEVFAAEDRALSTVPEESESTLSSTSQQSASNTASLLNEAMRRHSGDANLVVTNLPFIRKDQCAQQYFQFIDKACEGLENVMLVRGSGAEVITAYA